MSDLAGPSGVRDPIHIDVVVESDSPEDVAKAAMMYQLLLRFGKSEVVLYSKSKEALEAVYELVKPLSPVVA